MLDRRRLLVSVSPRVFGDVLHAVLEDLGLDDVVSTEAGVAAPGPFDAAIVSQPVAIDADVVILLPDVGGGPVVVVTRDGSRTIDVRGVADLLAVLDQHVVAAGSRSERLMRGCH